MRNLARKYNDDWDDEDEEDFGDMDLLQDSQFPTQIIFTNAGSYVVFYKDNSLAVATWTWENDSQTKLRYSWNYADMGYNTGSWQVPYGVVEVGFRGNQLYFTFVHPCYVQLHLLCRPQRDAVHRLALGLVVHHRVNLCRGDILVAEDILYGIQTGALLHLYRTECVTAAVIAQMLSSAN